MNYRSHCLRTIDDLHQERLDGFERMLHAGVAIAVPAALNYCHEHSVQAPAWLMGAATNLLCDLLKREKSKRRGRASGYLARHRQDRIDYSRWCQVEDVRENQKRILEQVELARQYPSTEEWYVRDRERMLAWVGNTLSRAYECAAMMLLGTDAYGSPEAIKRSYFQVQRNSATPGQAMRYHMLDFDILNKLGLEHHAIIRPGRKLVPLYQLTIAGR